MRNKQKTAAEVKGALINCKDFDPCPMCYGCRNFTTNRVKCINKCGVNEKFDTCNVSRHRPDLLARMITKERIVVKSVPNRITQSESQSTET